MAGDFYYILQNEESEYHEQKIFALCFDGERVAGATIQRALPPSGEVVEGVGQTLCVQPMSSEVEDGDLLAWSAGEGLCVAARDEDSIVGVAAHLDSHAHIFHKKGDVANGMVLTLACGSHDGNATHALSMEELHGLGLVVGLLIGIIMHQVGILLLIDGAERVAIAYDDVGHMPTGDVLVGSPIATNDKGGLAQDLSGKRSRREVAPCKDYSINVKHNRSSVSSS